MTIKESEEFTLDSSSVQHVLEYDPYYDTYDWVFTWETNYWTESSKDKVYLSYHSGNDCEAMPVTLEDTGPGDGIESNLTYQIDPATGAVSYLHEMRWVDRECHAACQYAYTVESGLGNETESHTPTGKGSKVKFPTYCLGS